MLLQQNRQRQSEQAAQRLLRLGPGHAEAVLRAAILRACDQDREAFRKRQADLLYEAFQP